MQYPNITDPVYGKGFPYPGNRSEGSFFLSAILEVIPVRVCTPSGVPLKADRRLPW